MAHTFGAFLRHNRRIVVGVLVVVVAMLLVTSFSSFEGGSGGANQDTGWKIEGEPVKMKELNGVERSLRAQGIFGMPPNLRISDAVVYLAFQKEAHKLGITATPLQIERFFQSGPFQALKMLILQDIRKNMPIATEAELKAHWENNLNQRLRALGVKDEDLDEFARREVERTELQRFIAATAKLTPLAVRQKQQTYIETFTVDIVNVASSSFANTVSISTEELKKEYEDGKAAHMTTHRVKVLYAKVAAEKFKDKATVTDEQIARYYEQNAKEFVTDKGEPKKLETVRDEIRSKLLLQAAARPAFEKASEIAERLYNTPRPANFKESDLRAYHAANAASFVDAFGKVLTYEAISANATLTAALRHRAAVTAQFHDCLKQIDPALGVTLQETDFFEKEAVSEKFKLGKQFRDEAFTLNHDRVVGNAIRDENDGYVIAFLDALTPAQEPFEKVEPKLRTALLERKLREAAVKGAEAHIRELRLRMDKSATFVEAADALKLKPVLLKPFNILNAAKVLSADELILLDPIMTRIVGEGAGDFTQVAPTRDGAVFAYVRDRQAGDPKAFEKEMALMRNEILEDFSTNIRRDWMNLRIYGEIQMPAGGSER